MDMVRIEGRQLEDLIETLKVCKPRLLRIAWHDDHVTVKVNEGIWSPPLGKKQEAY